MIPTLKYDFYREKTSLYLHLQETKNQDDPDASNSNIALLGGGILVGLVAGLLLEHK